MYTVAASDAGACDGVLLDASGVPAGASHAPALPQSGSNPASILTWTPTHAEVGVYGLTYTATDGVDTTTCTVTIRVVSKIRPGQAP
jgi:hypothetical protein